MNEHGRLPQSATPANQFDDEQQGATMLEYALLAALIAIVVVAAVTFIGRNASTTFSNVGQELGNVNN